MSIEFPLLSKRTGLGVVPDALIPVQIFTKAGYQTIMFILDTGADFTMLPHHMADVIGIELASCPKSRSYGIEGDGLKVYLSKVQIKLGEVELRLRCLFSEKENTPYLLGRADLFSSFNIVFDNQNRKIKFSPIH